MEIQDIFDRLPTGWQDKCREEKALTRARSIKNPKDLLTSLFAYVTCGFSMSQTSNLLTMKDMPMKKESFFERLQKSENWLKWILKSLLEKHKIVFTKPDWLSGDLELVDATDIALQGSAGTDYKIHSKFSLFGNSFSEIKVTNNKSGEKLENFELVEGNVVIGDRAYISICGVEYCKKSKAHFVLRYRTHAFHLYGENGERINIPDVVQHLGDWETKSIDCYYSHDKKLKPIRVCIMRKDENAINAADKKIKRVLSKKQLGEGSEASKEMNKYIILCTDLVDVPIEQIFLMYRCRWQIELMFKELKQQMALSDIPVKSPKSVMPWLYAKLIISIISMLIIQESFFPPEERLK